MRVRRCLSAITAICLAVCLLAPAGASANAFDTVANALNQSSTSALAPCQFSSAELTAALSEAPTLDNEYQASVNDAIKDALAARAAGACQPHRSGGRAPTLRPASLTGGGILPASISSHTASGLPLVVALIFALAVLAILGLGAAVLLNRLGWDPRAGRAMGQSLREAESRLGARWEDFSDRLRRD